MINHVWSVLCQDSAVDAESNNISLWTVLEQISVAVKKGPLPTSLPIKAELVTFWDTSKEKLPVSIETRVEIEGPDGKPIKGAEFNVSANKVRQRMRVNFNSLPIRGSGTHYFIVSIKRGRKWLPQAREFLYRWIFLGQKNPSQNKRRRPHLLQNRRGNVVSCACRVACL